MGGQHSLVSTRSRGLLALLRVRVLVVVVYGSAVHRPEPLRDDVHLGIWQRTGRQMLPEILKRATRMQSPGLLAVRVGIQKQLSRLAT